jgi:hypothetical protein
MEGAVQRRRPTCIGVHSCFTPVFLKIFSARSLCQTNLTKHQNYPQKQLPQEINKPGRSLFKHCLTDPFTSLAMLI